MFGPDQVVPLTGLTKVPEPSGVDAAAGGEFGEYLLGPALGAGGGAAVGERTEHRDAGVPGVPPAHVTGHDTLVSDGVRVGSVAVSLVAVNGSVTHSVIPAQAGLTCVCVVLWVCGC